MQQLWFREHARQRRLLSLWDFDAPRDGGDGRAAAARGEGGEAAATNRAGAARVLRRARWAEAGRALGRCARGGGDVALAGQNQGRADPGLAAVVAAGRAGMVALLRAPGLAGA